MPQARMVASVCAPVVAFAVLAGLTLAGSSIQTPPANADEPQVGRGVTAVHTPPEPSGFQLPTL